MDEGLGQSGTDAQYARGSRTQIRKARTASSVPEVYFARHCTGRQLETREGYAMQREHTLLFDHMDMKGPHMPGHAYEDLAAAFLKDGIEIGRSFPLLDRQRKNKNLESPSAAQQPE
jgi:hypothetical protein